MGTGRTSASSPSPRVYYGKGLGRCVLYSPSTRPPSMDCTICQKSELEIRLHKCPICFKWICEECSRRDYGRYFCSQRCADQFFFGDDED
jgi:hypothetical protein